jgi:hypothetical protein
MYGEVRDRDGYAARLTNTANHLMARDYHA